MSTELMLLDSKGIELTRAQSAKIVNLTKKITRQQSIIAATDKQIAELKRKIDQNEDVQKFRALKKELRQMRTISHSLAEQFNGACEIALADYMPGHPLVDKLRVIFPANNKEV